MTFCNSIQQNFNQMLILHSDPKLIFSFSSLLQHLQMTIQALQDELRTQRDLNHLLQQESGNRGAEHFTIELTEENFRRLQAEHDRQAKELFLLRKTLEEMELRIETQKQTLNARDESIKKLLEMLQSKGLPSKGMEDDNERTRRMAEAESQVNHLEVILDQKEKENMHLREVMKNSFICLKYMFLIKNSHGTCCSFRNIIRVLKCFLYVL